MLNSFQKGLAGNFMPAVSKLQANGTISWTKYLVSDSPDSSIKFVNALELSNNDIIVYGVCTYTSNPNLVNNILLRLNSSGNMTSYKTFKTINLPNGTGGVFFSRGYLSELNSGQIGLLGCLTDFNFAGKVFIMAVLDGSNNIVWSKSYIDLASNNLRISGLTVANNSLFVAGTFDRDNNVVGFLDLGDCIAKINALDGSIISDKSFLYSPKTTGPFYGGDDLAIAAINPGLIKLFSNGENDVKNNSLVALTYDTSLNIVKSKVVKGFSLSATKDNYTAVNRNGFIAFTSYTAWGDFYYMVADSNDNILQSRKVQFPPGFAVDISYNRTRLNDNDLLMGNYSGQMSGRYVVDNFSTSIYSCNNSCIGTDTLFASINNLPQNISNWGLSIGKNGVLQEIPFTITLSPLNIQQTITCKSYNSCDSLIISGLDTVCNINSPTVFKVLKYGNCCGKISWQLDTAAFSSITTLSDTSIAVQFKKEWNGFLFASINGCRLIKDSIKINVLKLPGIISLGNDTSLCSGTSIVLDAGNGFINYSWNTGAATQTINADKKGSYFIKATLTDGCYTLDTLEILNIYPAPSPSIYPRTVICKGQTDSLDAGNGFASYLWQDGSTDRYFAVTSPAKYWVTVKNINACIGSDTVLIQAIADTPSNFIYTDTAICQYETIVLKPFNDSFQQYEWSTDSKQPNISINTPGTYSLKVTDNNGCIGTQDITVNPKTCTNRLIFPNAFTPDRNVNTVFKPFARGSFFKYELIVYNRWGQLIFKTNDPVKGWDGTLVAKIQDAGVYVWKCKYQFYGEQPSLLKGTVLLIR